jgi:hypothetical protein
MKTSSLKDPCLDVIAIAQALPAVMTEPVGK